MARVRSRNTAPELTVRRLLFSIGYFKLRTICMSTTASASRVNHSHTQAPPSFNVRSLLDRTGVAENDIGIASHSDAHLAMN
jgi:hypothetical protein